LLLYQYCKHNDTNRNKPVTNFFSAFRSVFLRLLFLFIHLICSSSFEFSCLLHPHSGPGSSVGIATDYELDGLGILYRWGQIFRPSRPALGPTQSPVQWVPSLFRWQSATRACCWPF